MSVVIVCEGPTDELLIGLTTRDAGVPVRFRRAMSKGSAIAAARAIATRGEPTLLVLDADTTRPEAVDAAQAGYEWEIGSPASDPALCRIVLAVPEIESVCFEATALVERIVGEPVSEALRTQARYEPKAVLRRLTAGCGGTGDFLERLREDPMSARTLADTPFGRRLNEAVRALGAVHA